MRTDPQSSRSRRAPSTVRWIAVLIASAILHLVIIGWVSDSITLPSQSLQSQAPIIAQLRTEQPVVEAPIAKPVPPPPKPAARPKPRRPASAVPAAAPEPPVAVPESKIPEQAVDVPREPAEPGLMAQDSTAGPVAAGAAPVDPVPLAASPSEAVPAVSAAESSQAIGPLYKFSLPPSVDLKYDVQALRDGQIVYGGGKISWKSDGVRYTVDGEAGILFFTLLNFRSSGEIDQSGVAPEVYSEKRFRRSETNTHFHRERNTISFSASTVSYPREGGEQDRASIIWQLTGIGRGDGEKFVSDAQFDFFVAGVRDGEPWRMRVIGMEEVETGSGRVGAWHLVRIPRPGSYDQKLDIWLAPQHEWYPVKLRFTEKNGDYLDMSLSNSTLAAAR